MVRDNTYMYMERMSCLFCYNDAINHVFLWWYFCFRSRSGTLEQEKSSWNIMGTTNTQKSHSCLIQLKPSYTQVHISTHVLKIVTNVYFCKCSFSSLIKHVLLAEVKHRRVHLASGLIQEHCALFDVVLQQFSPIDFRDAIWSQGALLQFLYAAVRHEQFWPPSLLGKDLY